MKFFTSYFYQIRFFKPYQIPVSTAVWDPKWFHENKGQRHKFIDRRGVLNGIRCEVLHPAACNGLCHGNPCEFEPDSCEFLKTYRTQIFKLSRNDLMFRLEAMSRSVKQMLNFAEEPEIILIVHEAPSNRCSERSVLQDFFECEEFTRFTV